MSAYEIRFTKDSTTELVEIQQDLNSIPDPFKTRDKIPRSPEQFNVTNGNNNNNGGTTASPRHSTLDPQGSPIIHKQKRHHTTESSLKKANSDQVSSSIKVKSSNAVGPEAQQRVNIINGGVGGVGGGVGVMNTTNSTERKNTIDDDSIIRNSNKRSRSKIEDISNEKEKGNLGKALSNNQIMELNGKAEIGTSNNKINNNTISKSSNKLNKNINASTNTNIYMINDNIPLPIDGIATPPDTPPRSPYIIQKLMQKRSEDDGLRLNQMILDGSQPMTPPSSSSDSTEFNDDDVSTQSSTSRVTRPIRISQTSRKRRDSHSPQKSQSRLSIKRSIEMNAYQPPRKLQHPRGRRPSTSEQFNYTEQPQDVKSSTTNSMETQKSQSTPIRSRIPRLSMSSKERPIIARKESQGSLSSQDSSKYNDLNDLVDSYNVSPKSETPRSLRSATSRPIINTSLIPDVGVGLDSPTNLSPTNNSSTSHSPTSHSPTSHLPPGHSPKRNSFHQKKPVSYDDVVIPTIAKKLKMKGQLPFVNHDALMGYSDEPEEITPTLENNNGYMDITDQVVNLFEGPKNKSHKRRSKQLSSDSQSSSDSQHHHQQKNSTKGHSRTPSKTHYIAPRKQPLKQTFDETQNSSETQNENSIEHSIPNNHIRTKRGRSRREEYIISVREDDDMEFIEPRSSMSLVPAEPSIEDPIVQIESNDQIYQEKIEPVTMQVPAAQVAQVVQEVVYEPEPVPVETAPDLTTTSSKKKKDRKKQKKNDLDDEHFVRKSNCRCSIQ